MRFRCKLVLEKLEDRNLLTFGGGYRTVDEIYSNLADIANNYPNITELVTYGQSYSASVGGVTTPGGDFLPGYDLLALHITNLSIPGPKPVFFLTTGIHSREISTPEVGMRFIDYLTQGYGNDPDATWLVDQHDTWVVPLVNPDGHWYVELGSHDRFPWLWRKNGTPNSCRTWPGYNGTSYGVDLNRNFDEHWGQAGTSTDTCSEIYRGPSVASEVETQALQDLMASVIPAQRGPRDNDPAPDDTTGIHIDVHTYGGKVLWPWGHTNAPPPNNAGLTAIGQKLATYNGYLAGQTYGTEYPVSGALGQYGYTAFGIPDYTFELDSNGFLDNYSSIDSRLWPMNKDAFVYADKIARTPYLTVNGPDSLQAATALGDSQVIVSARVDSTHNGNRTIAAAEFYVDTPPWADGAEAVPMEATDGTFDQTVEAVDGSISTDGLAVGRHLIYVRGQDAAGNWGPFSDAFVDIGGFGPHGQIGKRTDVAISLAIGANPTAGGQNWWVDRVRPLDRTDKAREAALVEEPAAIAGLQRPGAATEVQLGSVRRGLDRFFTLAQDNLDDLLPDLVPRVPSPIGV